MTLQEKNISPAQSAKDMKRYIKKRKTFQYVRHISRLYKRHLRSGNKEEKPVTFAIRCLKNVKIYTGSCKYENLFRAIKADISDSTKYEHFVYFIDVFKTVDIADKQIGNLSIDYTWILEKSFQDFFQKSMNSDNRNQLKVLEAVIELCGRTEEQIIKSNHKNKKNLAKVFQNLVNGKAEGLEEALQRILFLNQCLWQCGHRLMGLGRLDMILFPYYEKDLAEGRINTQKAGEILKEFLLILHKDYWFKGDVLSGDTGQIIVLGGSKVNGEYEYNELTFLFIDIIQKLHIPDPKILLRVNKNTPREIFERSIRCVATGLGEPLFANDDVIIPQLIRFGYKEADACQYVTSACWEPMIAGKSAEQNNSASINYLIPFEKMLDDTMLQEIGNKEELLESYFLYLNQYLISVIQKVKGYLYEEAPLLSLFIEKVNDKDISYGSAFYNDCGFTTVGLSNTVNAILNIDKLVFSEKKYTVKELEAAGKKDYKGNEALYRMLKENKDKWGHDTDYVIQTVNRIIAETDKILEQHQNDLGKRIKIGLSSPDYISGGKVCRASLDGRKNGEPLNVHISGDMAQAYTELISFASQLDYSGMNFNGNVVDFMVEPDFIFRNFDKFVDFVILSVRCGFFEMQMNVVSSKTLIEARENPDKFPDLIVRVWGFSAYFNELPEDYKKVLIERALRNEGVA